MAVAEQEAERPIERSGDQEAPGLRTFSDRPIAEAAEDRLGFDAHARALSLLIDSPETDTPLTVAVNAPWGAGKTSLAALVQRALEEQRQVQGQSPHIICSFDAWLHQSAPNVGIALAAVVAKTAAQHRIWYRRVWSPVPTTFLSLRERRRRILLQGLAAGAVATSLTLVTVLFGPSLQDRFSFLDDLIAALPEDIKTGPAVLNGASAGALLWVGFSLWSKLFAGIQAAARFFDDPKSEAARGTLHELRNELRYLFKHATNRRGHPRLIVFVDNLERCPPPRALEVCEVASQLLSHPGVVTVVLADMRSLVASAETRYALPPDAASDRTEQSVGRAYLEKIVQFQIDVPIPTRRSIREMITARPLRVSTGGTDQTPFRQRLARGILLAPGVIWRSSKEAVQWASGIGFIFSVVMLGLALLGLVANLLGGLIAGLLGVDGTAVSKTIFFAFIVCGLAGLAVVVGLDVRDARRTRDRAHALERAIRAAVADGETVHAVIKERVLAGGTGVAAHDELFDQLLTKALAERPDEAETALVSAYASQLPRAAKRTVNRISFLKYVVSQQGLLGEITNLHIAKWGILLERWPALAAAVSEDPSFMARVESDGGDSAASLMASISCSADLRAFLKAEPALGAVATRLVAVEPASVRESLADRTKGGDDGR